MRGTSATRYFRWLLLAASLAGIALALYQASRRSDLEWPSVVELSIAAALSAATLVLGGASWAALLSGRGNRGLLARGYMLAQLGKYVPGGVVQLAQLYSTTRKAGVSRPEVAAAMPTHALAAAVAPGAVMACGLALVGDHLPLASRALLAFGGVVSLVAGVARPVMAALLDRLHRLWKRVPDRDQVPAQLAIGRAFVWGVACNACFCAGYAVLAGATGWRQFSTVACGFLVASTVGFLALVFPAGLGAREATLVVLLHGVLPVGTLLSAAVALRAVQALSELVVAGAASGLAAFAAGWRAPEGLADGDEPIGEGQLGARARLQAATEPGTSESDH